MPIVVSNRKWYRLHASTWVVALVAVGVLVLLVAPGAFDRSDWPYEVDHFQHGWPWPFLEFSRPRDYEDEATPWLLRKAWQFEGDVAWGWLAADAACAVGITIAVAAVWEWRRRRRVRLWHLTLGELLLATLAVAGILGWWRANVREEERQYSVVESIDDDDSRYRRCSKE